MKSSPVSLVSGAASGIGRQMAQALERAGHRLVLTDIDSAGLDATCASFDPAQVVRVPFDVRDHTAWRHFVELAVQRFGAIDFMFNVAGTLTPGYVTELTEDVVDRQIDVNVKGTIYATTAGARQMVRQGHGHILNVASIAAISHVPGLSVYGASKHAVRGFTLAAAHELAERGVSVTVFCPDAVETPMLKQQEAFAEAAMTFGAGRGLTLVEVERALFKAMRDRPLELVLDVPRSGRALAARLANALPNLTRGGVRHVQRLGRKVQARRAEANKP